MRTWAWAIVVSGILGIGCGGGGGGGSTSPPIDTSRGTGGRGGTRGGGSGGSGGSSTAGTGGTETGGIAGATAGTGGSADASSTDAPLSDATPAASDDAMSAIDGPAASDASASDGGPVLSGDMVGFYEAEAVMPAGPNEILAPAIVGGCGATNPVCGAPGTIKPEAMCCSQGKEVRQLLRGRGGLQFNKISAPADGMYDVTWWYHCGLNDNFGDPGCGGEPNHPAAGCRPHILTVNGAKLPKVYEFHCFPGPWGQIHAVTTTLPLKAGGDNSIRVVATTGRDAADLDAIAIYPEGKGVPPMAFAH